MGRERSQVGVQPHSPLQCLGGWLARAPGLGQRPLSAYWGRGGGPVCAALGPLEFPEPWSPIVCLFVFAQIPSHLILLRSPIPSLAPPGIRTEQDFYVRLIDSMTKQVSFFISRRRGTQGRQNVGESRRRLLHSRGLGLEL